jgi:heterodisulfide reductase subunit B2
MVTLSYYPGCSLKTGSKFYEASIRKVFSTCGIDLAEIDDWSCCGSSPAHTVDEGIAHALAGRNLALAEKKDAPFFAPCPSCYSRSKITNDTLRADSELQNRVNNAISPLECTGSLEIKNIIEVLDEHVGISAIAKMRRFDLSDLKVVPYYGCVLTRLMRVKPYDDRENPKSMDRLLEALGVGVLPWPFKMECCGASKTLTDKEMTVRLSERIVARAIQAGADAIVTPCPLCQMNLDLLPSLGSKAAMIPTLFLSEVFELALYGKLVGMSSHFVAADAVVKHVRGM